MRARAEENLKRGALVMAAKRHEQHFAVDHVIAIIVLPVLKIGPHDAKPDLIKETAGLFGLDLDRRLAILQPAKIGGLNGARQDKANSRNKRK
jgi:hypothetical protein